MRIGRLIHRFEKESQVQLANVSGDMPMTTALAKETASHKLQVMEYKKQNDMLNQQVASLANEVRVIYCVR